MQNALLAQLAAIGGARFASFTYTNKQGETAKYSLILGGSTEEMYRKDIEYFTRALALLTRIGAKEHNVLACAELLASRQKSLEVGIGHNPDYTNADTYLILNGFRGVKMHRETGALYVTGLVERKTVLVPGEYKTVKSAPKTIAKRKLEKMAFSGRFRQFDLSAISRAALNGEVLELA